MKCAIKQTLQIKSLKITFNESNKENKYIYNNHTNKFDISKRKKETKTKSENQEIKTNKRNKNIIYNFNYVTRPKINKII